MTITLNKQHLVEAFQKYNQDYLENPDKYSEIDGTQESAEVQVDHLLGMIPEEAIQEVRADIQTEVVAEFIAFCEEEGTLLPEGYFETFFGA